MSQLALTNIITISVSQSNPGVGNYNTSNLALFTDDAPASSFGTNGYAAYLTPTQVGVDFGTGSKTFAMANSVFSQQPNILAGGGQLIIILLNTSIQTLTPSAAPASGAVTLTIGSFGTTASISATATAANIQSAIQALSGLSEVVVTGTFATVVTIQFYGVYGAVTAITIASNTFNGSISVAVASTQTGEKISAAISRTVGLVQYFGILVNESCGTGQIIPSGDVVLTAAVVQPLVKIMFFVTNSVTDLTITTGMISANSIAGNSQTRINYYGDTSGSGVANALNFIAGYAGLGLSVNFNGSNTTITMHLKQIVGTVPDPTMTQTILNEAIAAGADTYVSLQGVPAVFCSSANTFYDRVYNQLWFTGALQVAGFNYLAQTGTKIPQTEQGMDGLKGAYRVVCEQARTNQYCAAGAWTSPNTFGNSADLIANVAQRGYYIYSLPITQQTQTARAARQAPLVQIALKEAGAIQSSSVIVTINA